MIPSLFTSGSLIAPGPALISSGYVAGSTLGAQNLNWYLNHLTLEINNVLTAAGVAQNTGSDTQLRDSVQALINTKISAVAKSANFNVPAGTTGTRQTFLVTTGTGGAGDVTATLPVLSGTNGRVRILKVDTGTNKAIADGNGTEKIGAKGVNLTFELYGQGDWVEVEDMGTGTFWNIVGFGFNELAYTPTFTNFGTCTGINFTWRRESNRIKVMGKFTVGTLVAAEGRVSLPGILVSDAALIPNVQVCGSVALSLAQNAAIYCIIESGLGYIVFGTQSSVNAGLAKMNGSSFVAGVAISVQFEIPISGWNG